MRTAIYNGILLTPFRRVDGGVLIEDGKIVGLFDGVPPAADRSFDVDGRYISPGFIDIHTHGGGGAEYVDGTPEAYETAGKFHMQYGATTIYPTLTSSLDEELFAALDAFKIVKNEMRGGPDFPGLHLEGPYFSYEERGAQDPRYLRAPSPEHYLSILDRCENIARWSSAPELPGALELGDELVKRGILCAIGHSNATYEQVLPAFEHGYNHVTHLYSGCSMLRRIGPWRHLGVVESAYLIDDMTVEIIADGCHLPPELLHLILRSKPWDKISLVTDSMRCAGMPEGSLSKLGSAINGQNVVIEDGVAMLPDHTCFAGSIATVDRLVRTMYKKAGLPLLDAVRMITFNPAHIMGISGRKGSLSIGMDADICVFDDNINMDMVFAAGEMVVNKISF